MASKGPMSRLEMKFSSLFASIFVQAVLHKEFVGAKSDKLLGDVDSLVRVEDHFEGLLALDPASVP